MRNNNDTHLVQIRNRNNRHRKVAVVREPRLLIIDGYDTVYDLVSEAVGSGVSLTGLIERQISSEALDYTKVYEGATGWKLLPPIDHPIDPNRCMLSGTGLTHKASADSRQKMHVSKESDRLTDSMIMYNWGLEGGRPGKEVIGVQPEWFYKGNGSQLRGHGDVLRIPPYADDGGEEPEIAGIYFIDPSGNPWRVGLVVANEFSDHMMERKNYLYLAPSKIRECAIGPELVINPVFEDIKGMVRIYRDNRIFWGKKVQTGENHMSHNLDNIEYHQFKYENHRLPGQLHIHFFGADAFSFGHGIRLEDNDLVEVAWEKMGRPLKNIIKKISKPESKTRIYTCV